MNLKLDRNGHSPVDAPTQDAFRQANVAIDFHVAPDGMEAMEFQERERHQADYPGPHIVPLPTAGNATFLRRRSISAQLFFYYALCLTILIGVSGFALYEIVRLNEMTNEVVRHELPEIRALGKMTNLLSSLRMDQASLALARDERSIESAEDSAAERLTAMVAEEAAYQAMPLDEEELARLREFQAARDSLVAEHDAWIAQSHDLRLSQSPEFQERAQTLYTRAEHALEALIDREATAAELDFANAALLAERAIKVFILMLVFVALLAVLVFVMVRNRISRPLASITKALSALAEGSRSVVLPESNRRDEIGEMSQAFEVFRANAAALQASHEEAEAAHLRARMLARHDVLTGLPNRRVLVEELHKALARVSRGGVPFSVLLIDLDRFKPVNDIHGHQTGDLVLSEIATRLRSVLRGGDTLARIGGDEFVIVSDTIASQEAQTEAPIRLAERVQAVVCEPIWAGDAKVEVGASIGIALCPADGNDADFILRAADIAMYRAKRAGRGSFRFYEQSMDTELRARAALEADVRRAVSEGHIQPYYQPLLDLRSGRLLGFEILARWSVPERGIVPPGTFIPIIEHLGLISEFTLDLLRRACRDSKLWPPELTLSINISPLELTDPLFPVRLMSVLSECGFAPSRLEIEITENALVTDLETAKSILTSLQSFGIKIALDDFGTGYSSLYHLRELHLDRIKIDRSFVQSINQNPESLKLVNAILGLAKSLALPTTAEGIEDADVLKQMSEAGVDIGQGFFFSQALPAAEATVWMEGKTPLQWKIA